MPRDPRPSWTPSSGFFDDNIREDISDASTVSLTVAPTFHERNRLRLPTGDPRGTDSWTLEFIKGGAHSGRSAPLNCRVEMVDEEGSERARKEIKRDR